MHKIYAIDSHTAGEPTRVVIAGGPDLGGGSLSERRTRFQQEQDTFRSTVVNEPRGSDVLVGALLCDPRNASAAAGVIFFNNVGCLGMCGHGLIGVVTTLAYLGRIDPGEHRFETPVGDVRATLHNSGDVSIANVPSYRLRQHVPLDVPGYGRKYGDIAWGGNWFFLMEDHGLPLHLGNLTHLMDFTARSREALTRAGITADGEEIDHIELTAPSSSPGRGGRNFVLCPGLAYDRSPCGTGFSAKLACLAADGMLQPGEVWRQEGILGTSFDGWYEVAGDGRILPTIRGRAYISAETTLILDPEDPFRHGVRPGPSPSGAGQ